MPSHRFCSTAGCGGPAVYGSLCFACAGAPEVNLVDFGDHGGVQWRTPDDVTREQLDAAVHRALYSD